MEEHLQDERTPTIDVLTRKKPKRGRPKHAISRQSVYVELSKTQKKLMSELAKALPKSVKRADIPDFAIVALSNRFEALRQAVSDRDRELPEGITDLESLYFLWDLDVDKLNGEKKWTSLRLSPQQAVDLGRLQGTFNALFGSNRTDVFALALTLLGNLINNHTNKAVIVDLSTFSAEISR